MLDFPDCEALMWSCSPSVFAADSYRLQLVLPPSMPSLEEHPVDGKGHPVVRAKCSTELRDLRVLLVDGLLPFFVVQIGKKIHPVRAVQRLEQASCLVCWSLVLVYLLPGLPKAQKRMKRTLFLSLMASDSVDALASVFCVDLIVFVFF